MNAPPIFGVAPTSHKWVEWRVGPMIACAYTRDVTQDKWVGVWNLDTASCPELARTGAGRLLYVAQALESWLRVHFAELAGALRVELRERGEPGVPLREVEAAEHERCSQLGRDCDDARAVAARLAAFIESRTVQDQHEVDADVVRGLAWGRR